MNIFEINNKKTRVIYLLIKRYQQILYQQINKLKNKQNILQL